MKVLVACEYSGIVRDAFIRAGHDAISVDLLPSESDFGPHWQGDFYDFMQSGERFDLVIAHPPCTYLTNSGVRWLHEPDSAVEPLKGQPRWNAMRQGAAFFNYFKRNFGQWDYLCIENPTMHGYAAELCGKATQTFQPWHFGVPQFKAIGLQLHNLPKLEYTNVLTPPKKGTPEHKAWSKVHRASPGKNRSKERSLFFREVAEAMAEQWGSL